MEDLWQEDVYEGLPASSAVAMTVMERSGIRRLIDSLVEYDRGQRKLSPGMAVKAMIAPIFDMRKKMPLSGIRHFHRATPTDLFFGKNVSVEGLNDSALGRSLDDLFDAGLEDMFWKCSSMIKRKFGFDSKIKHMDATNYSVWSVPPEYYTDGALPAFGGNAKNGRNDLLQYSAATVTDGDRILEYCKAYSGNTADGVMNAETIEFLKERIDAHENVLIADCKLVSGPLINELNNIGMGFISKLPSSFSGKIRDRIIASAMSGIMDTSSVNGYETYETECETEECGKLRVIAYRSPKGTKKAMEYLERQGLREAEKRFKPFLKKEFACEADAKAMFDDVMKEHVNSAYIVTGRTVRIDEIIRRKTRGRPPKGSAEPETKEKWKVETSMIFDKNRAVGLANVHGMSVIVTNLRFVTEDAENIRHGATSDTVLRLYLDQHKVEKTYRLMKSGMGVDSVYVHTPSRANALLFVVAIATLVSSIMDALIKRSGNGRQKTVKQVCTEIQSASFIYHRNEERMSVMGPKGSAAEVSSFVRILELAPSDMFSLLE